MSAGQLTSLLAQVHQDFRIYGDFLASLAIMGEDGTTRRRLDGTEHALVHPRIITRDEAFEQLAEGTKPPPDFLRVTEFLRMDG